MRSHFACVRAAIALCLACAAAAAAQVQEADEYARALAKADSYRAYDEAGFSYDFASIGEEGSSLMRVSVRLSGEEAALVRYLEPAKRRGRLVLVRGNSFWLLDEDMKSPIRISPRQLLFGQASAGDVSRISFRSMYSVAGLSASGDGVVLHLAAKPGAGATYDLVDLSTDSDYRPIEAACKGHSGALLKTIRYERYQTVDGKELLAEFSIVDAVSGKTERARLSGFDRSMPPDSDFSVQALKFRR